MPLTPYPPDVDYNVQAVEIPSSRKPGQSGVWKNAIWDRSTLTAAGQPRTLFELFEQSVARYPRRNVFARRSIISQPTNLTDPPTYGTTLIPTTYATAQTRRTNLGSALLNLERAGRLSSPSVPASATSPAEITFPGVPYFGKNNRVKNGARRGWAVGMWCKNREEWQIIDLACQAYGLVSVSLYETLGPDVAEYITNHSPLSIIFSSAYHLASLMKIAPRCPTLRIIVSIDPLPASERQVLTEWAHSVNLELLDMTELEQWGSEQGIRCDPGPVKGVKGEHELDRDRIVTISYTSGTTGNPKGVVLTNFNFTTAVLSNSLGNTNMLVEEEFVYFSLLPLSHIYARFVELVVMFGYGTIGYTSGDVTKLLEDAQLIKPHFIAGVPRVYNRIYSAIKTQMSAGGLKGALLTHAVNTKLANLRETGQVTHVVYDALVFRKVRALLGGRVFTMSSGAAPLSPDVHEMMRVCFSCELSQGCGMTETVGTMAKGIPTDKKQTGNCGMIQPCNYVKLVDVPDMGYTSNDSPNPRGEICTQGTNITPGYLHNPEATAATIDKDGWLHTGDVGEIDPNGRLKIIDRIKNVVKLSQGEYVALEKLEGVYVLDPLFATLLVHGDSTRSSLVAVGVLDPVEAVNLVHSVLGKTLSVTDIEALEAAVQDKRVRKQVVKSFAQIAKKYRLNGFETIKGVHLTLKPFSEDVITPTFKVKRHVAAKKYAKEIDQAYAETEDGAKL